jgi:hypothetical protein
MSRKIGGRTPNYGRVWIAVAGVACAVLIAACGSSSHDPNASSKKPELARSECMRKHGVPSFPDPTFGPRGIGVKVTAVAGVDPDPPAFQAANKICSRVATPIPGGG